MIRYFTLILFFLYFTQSSIGQSKEKIRGSKRVTLTIREVQPFINIEIGNDIELQLLPDDSKSSIEIEADDNLQEVIVTEVLNQTLFISLSKQIISKKALNIRVRYTKDLKLVTVKDQAQLTALAPLKLSNITIKNFDKSASFLNVDSENFAIMLNDKSRAELNIKSKFTTVELSNESNAKALLNSKEAKIDLYQSSEFTIEGDIDYAKIRTDNRSEIDAFKLTVTTMDLTTEGRSKAKVNIDKNAVLSLKGTSKVELKGKAKIDLKTFVDQAALFKKK